MNVPLKMPGLLFLAVLLVAALGLFAATAAKADPPGFFTEHISRDLNPLPPAPAGPCSFPIGRHIELTLRVIIFPERQISLTPNASLTVTNLLNGNAVTVRTPSSQHYTFNADGSFDIASTGLVWVVTTQGGLLGIDAGLHVLHFAPVYDDSGNLVDFDITSTFDAGPQDPLFPAVCEAIA